MSLENGRDVIRGVLLLVFAATAYWVDFSVGVALVAGVASALPYAGMVGWPAYAINAALALVAVGSALTFVLGGSRRSL